jgi:citrate lyase subunit beta/citryl-CoA lyase
VLHPDQIDAANEAFAPSAADFERASRIVEAYAHATGVQARGAVMFGDEMIDEASYKMAQAIVARGRASGLGPDGLGQDGSPGRDMGGPGRDIGGPGNS